ncbi:hypothetical protein C1H46_027579 [Malus baccata]|uniref:BZIP domain-containing protein n=1 Tax=Malus baccata TaxID=106549 RepID=A0A540LK82_MALBA|nr:hypothetical protein C1H46_027579 [Malus baccata]
MDQDVTKKLKGLDGTAVRVGYDNPKEGDNGNLVLEASKSLEQNSGGLTDGNDGDTKANHLTQRKNGSDSMQSAENDVKVHTQVSPTEEEAKEISTNVSGYAPPAAGFVGVSLGSPYEKIGVSTAFVAASAGAQLPFGTSVLFELKLDNCKKNADFDTSLFLCFEQHSVTGLIEIMGLVKDYGFGFSSNFDERQMKREKRKQANRESARRSRLRKQAEYEELVKTCESLNEEKIALQSKMEELKGDSETLRLENAALREKLKNAQAVTQGGIVSVKIEVDLDLPNDAKNILSNLGSVSRNDELDREKHESSMSETKFHQLMESNARTDAVAAR